MQKKLTTTEKEQLKLLKNNLKKLQTDLVSAKKLQGLDENISVKVKNNKARFNRIKLAEKADKAVGKYSMDVYITAKSKSVFVPISIASGKKPTGFVYHISGNAESSIISASVKVRGENLKQITVGTLEYCEILPSSTVLFNVQIDIKGKLGKVYYVVINRLNYKLSITDARYQQYLKPLKSEDIKFS